MNLNSTKGSKVIFTGENGSNHDQKEALKVLTPGKTYVVDKVDVGTWYSYVRLQGISGRFNTVMFDDIDREISL